MQLNTIHEHRSYELSSQADSKRNQIIFPGSNQGDIIDVKDDFEEF
jgi:hypothetical protein